MALPLLKKTIKKHSGVIYKCASGFQQEFQSERSPIQINGRGKSQEEVHVVTKPVKSSDWPLLMHGVLSAAFCRESSVGNLRFFSSSVYESVVK